MITAGAYLTVKDAANELGLTVGDVNELVKRNEVESLTLVLRSSVAEYATGRA